MKKTHINKSEILGAFSMCLIRQYPYLSYQESLLFPALKEIEKCCNSWEDRQIGVLAILDLQDFVRTIISVCPAVKEYNRSQSNRSGENDTSNYLMVDRFSEVKPERDFIDLDALERNVISYLSES